MIISYIKGNKCYYDIATNKWFHFNTKKEIESVDEMKCVNCGNPSSQDGHDFCISNLGNVTNACCGHGDEGYIQFDDGTVIRGKFTIERKINYDL